MTKIKYIIIGFLLLITPIIYAEAGVCDPVIDKNGYCDEVGTYTDPTLQQIKSNNCSGYTKKINDYCSVTCREEAKTYFPTKVPFVAVDRYDAILGGNHFKWEEIKTWSKRTCEMSVNYKDYVNDLWGYGVVPDGQSSSLSSSSIRASMSHMLRELHQRYTDVKVCDLLNDRITVANGYNVLTVNYYNANGGAAKARAKKAAYAAGFDLNNCNKCKKLTQTISVQVKPTLLGNMIFERGLESLSVFKPQFEKFVQKEGISLGDYDIKNYVTLQSLGAGTGGTSASKEQYAAYTCIYPNDKRVAKPTLNGNTITCPDGDTSVKDISKGNARTYHAVIGENLINFTGLKDTGYKSYCDYDGVPYNSEGWDIVSYSSSSNSSSGSGRGNYINSIQTMQNKLTNLINQMSECEKKMEDTSNKTNTTSITVNYSDNPSKIYQIKNGLKLNKKTVSTKTDKQTKVKYSTFYYSDCNDMTESQIKQKFIASLNSGKLLTNICNTKQKTIKVYEKITSTSEATYKYEMPSNVYRYVLKTTGEAIHSPKTKQGDISQTEAMIKSFTDKVKNNYQYIDVGYPNYAVHYTTPTGTYPMSLTYTNIGIDGHFIKKADYLCKYKVINRIISCPEGECPPEDDDDDDDDGDKDCVTVNGYKFCYPGIPIKQSGLNVIYRPISLSQPFPGENGKNRVSGENWTADDIKKYITNNRKVSENNVYNKTPLYSFTLDAKAIRNIRNYNKGKRSLGNYTVNQKEGYSDFNLKCSEKNPGKRCISNFIKNITTLGVKVNSSTCKNSNDFYGCADKPNQDNVKCSLTKDKKLECLNCGLKENKEKTLCKEGDK